MQNKPSAKYYTIIILVLALSLLTGYSFGMASPALSQVIISGSTGNLKQIMSGSSSSIFLFIFLNNTSKAMLSIILGLLFGVFPVYFIFINGFIIGLLAALFTAANQSKLFLAATLPHGIIEMTAIVFATTYGLWLGTKLFRSVVFKEKVGFAYAIKYSVIQFLRLIFPLLLAAALIETYITPRVMDFFK